jgi:cytochrome c-type biogenesis protein CcmF
VTRELAYAAIIAALALAVYGAGAAVLGVRRGRPDLIRSAELATFFNFGLLTLANLAMIYALVTRDFSISYVAQVGSRSTPLVFTVISLWSALEGSILFWGWVLSGYTALAIYLNRGKLGSLVPYATAVMLTVGAFFYLLLAGPANPFERVWPVPPDGPGPNPLLQNHWLMAVHPPLLYCGYVGMTVPFAFAIGALLSGRLDDTWIRVTRRWTVIAWGFLSLAIMAGMWWSYEVLGWGGYWAWDPVENASFLPWLTATAFLHSVMVQERRGMLRVWNLSLIVATFLLTILGTFLTRSGIISSVHAFTQGTIGYYFLGFIAIALLFSLTLLAGRSSELHSEGRLDSVASRETVFLINNLLLTAFTFTVLLGTLFPLLAEAVRGVQVSVGGPFFNRMTVPIMMVLIFLMGVGPALPWRRGDPEELKRRFVAPAVALAVIVIVAVALGARGPYTILAFGFAGFALVSNLSEFASGTLKRVRAHGEFPPVALVRLVGSNRRRYGGYTAHVGIVLMAAGIAASSSFKTEQVMRLEQGQTVAFGGYQLRFVEAWARQEAQRTVVGADIAVSRGSPGETVLEPRLNFYPMNDQPFTTPGVRSRPHEDLYLTLMDVGDGSYVVVTALIEPLLVWIWLGGIVIGGGALISLWPERRRRRPGVLAAAGQLVSAEGGAHAMASRQSAVPMSAEPTP